MGRVSRYKKIKSCDPFYKGTKPTDATKGLNLPPTKESVDQPLSRSFRDFLLYTQSSQSNKARKKKERKEKLQSQPQKQKSKNKTANKTPNEECQVEEEEEESYKDESLEFKRAKGESMNHYLLRIDYETNKRLMLAQRKTTQNSTRRKEYLKKRKLKSKLRKKGIKLEDAEAMDFKDLQDHIKFGEVVKEPPQLKQALKAKKTPKADLLLANKLQRKEKSGLKKQQDIIEERKKVIDIYRQVKLAKRTCNQNK